MIKKKIFMSKQLSLKNRENIDEFLSLSFGYVTWPAMAALLQLQSKGGILG